MLSNTQLSWNTLAIFNRSLSTMLNSGVHLLKGLQIAGAKSLDLKLQRVAKQVVEDIRRGSLLGDSMRKFRGIFPELMIDLIDVGEQTGSLPEVLLALAQHYDNLIRLRRTFMGAIAWPVFQLVAAILIVAGLIAVLGWITENKGGQAIDIMGLGLTGTKGAALWLTGCFGTMFFLFVAYRMFMAGVASRTFLHTFLLAVPVVGYCMRSFAIARFSWAFALTQQAGMSIEPSLESSLKATGNGAFISTIPLTLEMVRTGEELSVTLQETGLYPRDFLELVRVGETTGTVPEALERISPQLEDEARRSLSALTLTFAWLIWALVAGLISFIVIRVFMGYIALLEDLAH